MRKDTSLLKITMLIGLGAAMGCQSGRQATAGGTGREGAKNRRRASRHVQNSGRLGL